jgi:hypothetical protein
MSRIILRLDAELLELLAPLRGRGVQVAPLCRRLLREWIESGNASALIADIDGRIARGGGR